MIRSKFNGMGASVQRQAHSENMNLNVANAVHRQNASPSNDEPQNMTKVPQRYVERHQTIVSQNNSSLPLIEILKQRVRVLEIENRRLMANQGQLVAETNRRVEMNMNEVRSLKEELKNLQVSNKELRDLCCFLDDDRQKTRRMSREWQKFGRYTSEVMKQEVKAYQAKLRELENRQQLLFNENDDLKRLCLYLDEQRQSLLLSKTVPTRNSNDATQNSNTKSADNSIGCDSSGCGSSTGSQRGSEDEAEETNETEERIVQGYDDKQENTLRMITQQMQTSLSLERSSASIDKTFFEKANALHDDRLFEYIQSLETRIRQLELSSHYGNEGQWISNSNLEIEVDDGQISISRESASNNLGACDKGRKANNALFDEGSIEISNIKKEMIDSTTSTMTSSGTTYCSSDTDDSAETAVFVMGNEIEHGGTMLEVRTLGPIDEEREDLSSKSEDDRNNGTLACQVLSEEVDGSSQMPPTIAPVSASVSRLSLCSSELSLDGVPVQPQKFLDRDAQKLSETSSSLIDLTKSVDFKVRDDSRGNIVRDSLAEAVKVLRVHEMAARKNMRGLTAQETAIVQHMCQIAWDSLDRKSQSLGSARSDSLNSIKAQMTAV